jgi:TrmH family RNA methyltransferase
MEPSSVALEPPVVVLVSPRNPLNIGAVARAMSNFGCFDLRLVSPYRDAVAEATSATHAGIVLQQAREFTTIPQAVQDCALVVGTASLGPREARHTIHRLEHAADLLRAESGKVAILFGNEKTGLSNEEMAHCHWLLTIPSDLRHGSMNLGQAVAVCLYELARGRAIPELDNRRQPASAEPAEGASEERITELLLDVAAQSGYLQERTAESNRMKLHRLVKRMRVSRKDAEIWQGILRQILWRLSR